MCLAIPGRIVELSRDNAALAKVDVVGVRRNVNVSLLEDGELQAGDWVLIHVGFAMSKIEEAQARDQLRMLEALGEDAMAMDEIRGYAFAERD